MNFSVKLIKKYYITAFTFSLLFLQANAQTELLTLAENNLKGPVKSVVTKAHWLKEMFGELENNNFYFGESCTFTKDGFLTASSREENFNYQKEYTFKYDKNNLLTVKKSEFGKTKEKKQYTWKSVYDAQGRQTELNMYDEKNDLAWKQKSKYREDGKLKESVYYSSYGDVNYKLEYSYNDKAQLITTTSIDKNDKIFKKTTADYDAQGNKISELNREYSEKKVNDVLYTWEYVNNKKVAESKLTIANNKETRVKTEFDQWGNVTKKTEASGTVITTVYTFDSYNNWITATSSWKGFDGPVNYRQVREIKYY